MHELSDITHSDHMATLPRVVRICRRGGKIVQDCDCYIGREVKKGGWNLERSIWANPFKSKPPGSTLVDYERYVRNKPFLMHQIPLLVGKTLGCWCKPNPCHGDVLVKLVQEYLEEEEFNEEPDIGNEYDNAILDFPERKEFLQHNKSTEGFMEGIVIGMTYMKRPHVCIMAISRGKLIRPLDYQCNFVTSDSLCRVGTKFHYTLDKRHKASSLPHLREDVFVDISQIDHEPIDSVALNQLISSCAALQNTSAQQLLKVLSGNRWDATRTPCVFEGDNLPSSIITKVESDIVIYFEDGARHPRAQFHAEGHEFNLPVTSVGIIDKYFSGRKREVILKHSSINFVCVSLARPFYPWMSSHLTVARCYAMFTGVVLRIDNEITVL